jgi:tRNA A-37 threonylcarbamoyl transferase component Bud32
MNPHRWQKINELFQEASSLPPQDRGEFLNQACLYDEELRQEIESLLAKQSEAEYFFEQAIAQRAETTLLDNPQLENRSTAGLSAVDEPAQDVAKTRSNLLRLTVIGVVFIGALNLLLGWLALKYGWTERGGITVDNLILAPIVRDINSDSPNVGKLQQGDMILAINGERRFVRTHPHVVMRRVRDDAPVQLLVQRHGAEHLVDISLEPFPYSSSYRWRFFIFGFLRVVACLSLALLIALLRRHDQFSRLGVATYLALATVSQWIIWFQLRYRLTGVEESVELIVQLLWAGLPLIPLSYHSILLFPPGVRLPSSRFWLWLRNLLYAVTLILFLPHCLYALSPYFAWAAEVMFEHEYLIVHLLYGRTVDWYYPFGLLCFCAVLIRNLLLVRDPAGRRRLKIVFYGTLAAVLPVALLALSQGLVNTFSANRFPAWRDLNEKAEWITDLTTLLLPVAWGYAILTRRVYDVSVVVRRSLRYLLARRALSIILLLPTIALVYRIGSQPDQTIRQLIFAQPLSLALIALVSISLVYRRQMQTWLDRRFFREQYDREQALYRLIDEIREFEDLPRIWRRVSERIEAALHPSRIHFFHRADSGVIRLSYSSDVVPPDLPTSSDSALFRIMRRQMTALDYPLPRAIKLPKTDIQWLERLGAELIVPMNDSQNQPVGLMILGEKRSEEPYSPTDRSLLLAIARQMAIVFEVARLNDQVARKARSEYEVLARLMANDINLMRECPECGCCYDLADTHCGKCSVELTLTLPVERTIADRYCLHQLIGKGGMGAVYRATDLRLKRAIAIKIIKADYFGDRTALRRFEREALVVAQLNHPNIVEVYDYGQTPTGGAWVVMELVKGATLRDELNRRKKLPTKLIARLFEQLFDGVAAAHVLGVIHRDLKPENIVLVREDDKTAQVKILDFGLAKLLHVTYDASVNGTQSITEDGLLIGTPSYMSPEQLAGGVVGEESDIFALGVMLVEALTGQRPFQGRNQAELLRSILTQPLRLPAEINDLSQLNRALQKCLAKDVLERFRTIAEAKAEIITALQALEL